ncbi:LysM peptidoglycan-binding domain-containing protein [Vogesella facilis]|uniref:LysM peptidoglycan-binding domain-containing protein n=1 Tax=Vogesella facilis TaxID=1655232 RepID=A0ABV7RI62_9NEIS
MKKLTPLALSVSLAFVLSPAHANSSNVSLNPPQRSVDDGLAAGLDMMLLNSSLLRNGDSVWQRAREGFQMGEVNPELVRQHERFFSARIDYFRRTVDRSRKYLFFIMNEVERRGMPTEIALLPVVESAFVPTAQSQVGAAGLWQFMPATGRQYGLEQTWWYDGRRDVVEATRAALDYLQNLYTMFGDWSLALAAYNWGEGNLSRAIAKVRARGEVESYENIQMPKETRNYVPKLLAVRNLLQEPEKFGLRLAPLPNKPSFVAVATGRHMNIDIAARLAEMSVAEFKELNPAFNLPVYAHKNGRQMLLPENKLHKFETNLAKWDKPLLTWQVHVPDSDTSASELASRFEMNPNELITANNLKASNTLPAGRPVLVALHGNGNAAPALDATDIAAPASEAATLVAFAANAAPTPATVAAPVQPVASVTPANLVSKPQSVAVDSKPAETAKPPVTAIATVVPPVKPVASAVMVADSKPQTAAANMVASVAVSAADGKMLANSTVLAAASPAPRAVEAKPEVRSEAPRVVIRVDNSKPERSEAVRIITRNDGNVGRELLLASPDRVVTASAGLHTVAAGDTLFNISRRYGMTVTDLKQLNGLDDNAIKLGQNLKVLSSQQPTTALASSAASPLRTVSYSVRQPAAGPVPTDYVVQRGDTVFSIARKFSVSHTDILRWNDPEQLTRLQPGQKVRVLAEADGL